MSEPTVIAGALQPYAWGRHNAMLPFKPEAPSGPQAELWFGTHSTAPSAHIAGRVAAVGESPLLMKILAAATPLSIQVHPDAAGIRLLQSDSATAALLSDSTVKDEALIAVEQFDVLAGLRSVESALQVFASAGTACADVVAALATGSRLDAIRILLSQLRVADTEAMCAEMDGNEARIMRQVLATYAADPAVLVAFMLQPRTLQPGDAMFVPAGSVHAYVNGLGVEVMTSSDNVLRLGLTPKTIAVDAALAISQPNLNPVIAVANERGFAPADAPFVVAKVQDKEIDVDAGHAIALAFEGSITDINSGMSAGTGQAFLLHTPGHRLKVEGTAYLAWPKN